MRKTVILIYLMFVSIYVDELNVKAESLGLSNHVSCLSLNCRSIIASNHFELIV